jgi:hypothetical protein
MNSLFSWCRRGVLLAIILPLFLNFHAHFSNAQAKRPDAVPSTEDIADISTLFGGPYSFEATYYSKMSNFGVYYSKKLLFSHSTTLTQKLLVDSFAWYRNNSAGFGRGDLSQKYTYIITKKGDIRVAVWSERMDFTALDADEICAGGSVDSFSAVIPAGLMLNSYPENPNKAIEPISPCWIDVPPKKPEDNILGLIDAMSKHLFLAQEDSLQDESLLLFNASQWAKTEVAYAGELLIDGETGTYAVNRQSGTYRPDEQYLDEVARHFALKLGVRSVAVIFKDGTRRTPYLSAELKALPMTFHGSFQ